MENKPLAIAAAKEDAQAIVNGANIKVLLSDRIAVGIVSDPLCVGYLVHYLPEDMQSLVLRVLESKYFEF
jgi:hypothetical protein